MYTTQDNIESKLGTSLSDDQATYFSSILDDAIDEFIDNATETTFGGDTPTSVYVSGNDSRMLTIPTMNTITAVESLNDDGTDNVALTLATDYLKYPQGADDSYALRHLSGCWTCGVENYKISGILGYTEVPNEIVHVATEIAVNILTENNGNYTSEAVGDWKVTYSNTAKSLSAESQAILANYRRLTRDI